MRSTRPSFRAVHLFSRRCWHLSSPKLGSFEVTAKGGVVAKRYFDTRIAAALPVHAWRLDTLSGFLDGNPALLVTSRAIWHDLSEQPSRDDA